MRNNATSHDQVCSSADAAEDLDWSASPAPEAPDDFWVDDTTGEYIEAATGHRMSAADARTLIAAGRA